MNQLWTKLGKRTNFLCLKNPPQYTVYINFYCAYACFIFPNKFWPFLLIQRQKLLIAMPIKLNKSLEYQKNGSKIFYLDDVTISSSRAGFFHRVKVSFEAEAKVSRNLQSLLDELPGSDDGPRSWRVFQPNSDLVRLGANGDNGTIRHFRVVRKRFPNFNRTAEKN